MNFKRLVSEDGKNMSLGRVSFWLMLPLMFAYWCYFYPFSGKDAPESLLMSFVTVLGYNLGKKFTPKKREENYE